MKMKRIGYIGTYTKEESKGIYRFVLDTEHECITEVTLAAELENPTYLAISEDNQYLYAVAKEGEEGGIAAFSIEENGMLKKINSQTAPGSPPCHLSISGNQLVTANYHTGTVESYLFGQDGSLQPAISIMKHEGSGPHPRQEKPHLHFAGFTPDKNYVAAIDLGSDRLITYATNSGKLTKVHDLSLKPGSGPRHLVFHPNQKYAYVMTELSSEVIFLHYKGDGSFTPEKYYSTIPEDFTETNDGSAIHISSDGKFIYCGNRGHRSIAQFAVDSNTGELTFVEWTSTEGNWPRDFVLDPSEKFVVAVNQKSNDAALFRRDETSGKLTLLQSQVQVPEPVCVKFLRN
jgi:6-phosphogluconolactonase